MTTKTIPTKIGPSIDRPPRVRAELESADLQDTKAAFAGISRIKLMKAFVLMWFIGLPLINKVLAKFIPVLHKIPPFRWAMKRALLRRFTGGEVITEVFKVADRLKEHKNYTILDYGVEAAESQNEIDENTAELVCTATDAGCHGAIPMIAIKISALSLPGTLKRINSAVASGTNMDEDEIDQIVHRCSQIVTAAMKGGVMVLIDAEESWFQDAIDYISLILMAKFNTSSAQVINTYQTYLTSGYARLKEHYEVAKHQGFILGAKVVRGAYLEKENARAIAEGYESPVHDSKPATDHDFDEAIEFCLTHLGKVLLVVATHNQASLEKLIMHTVSSGISPDSPDLYVAQLVGMGDVLAANMAANGFRVARYVPFGPATKLLPYLVRRVQENSAVGGMASRECQLLKQELKRRKMEAKLMRLKSKLKQVEASLAAL